MSGLPQPTPVLIKRLRRVANSLRIGTDQYTLPPIPTKEQLRAWANTCDQAAGRLEDLYNGKLIAVDREDDDGTGMSADEKAWLG